MRRGWTFGQKIGAGYALLVGLVILMCMISVLALRSVVSLKDRVITADANSLREAERLSGFIQERVANFRGFLITRDLEYLQRADFYRSGFQADVKSMRARLQDPESLRLLDRVEAAEAEHNDASQGIIGKVRAGQLDAKGIAEGLRTESRPKHEILKTMISEFITRQQELLEQTKQASTDSARRTMALLIALAIIGTLASMILAWLLTRALSRQIGSAVQHVQNSAAELQAAANEQASGAKEQAAAVNEISTTIKELLVTSRQIADSSQQVAHISEDAASSAQLGDKTVVQGQEAVETIKRQTDVVVAQAVELGRRSQQIGAVVELITELADQTNILAINATIESVGAGESGKRFAVVADEIRKLADRVGSSTKDIRALVDEIRNSVNTTVMATESGSKAVDTGTRRFADIAKALQQIVGSVTTASQAAREIELSTKQQATAVEQVNSAIASAAQAVHQLEANSTQTLQTSSRLAALSSDLMGLVQKKRGRAA